MTIRTEKASTLKLQFIRETKENGDVIYGTKSIKDISPELSDQDFLALAQEIGQLQALPVENVYRIDTAILTQA